MTPLMTFARLILVGGVLFSTGCSAQSSQDEAVPISRDWINAQAECHDFAAGLVQPIVDDQMRISSVSVLWLRLSMSDSELKDILAETAYRKRQKAFTSPREVFEIFNQLSSQISGYPEEGCGPLFHELVAEKLYLGLTNGDDSAAPDELKLVPNDNAMLRRRRLLELLISAVP
jgi:hypothetical protein